MVSLSHLVRIFAIQTMVTRIPGHIVHQVRAHKGMHGSSGLGDVCNAKKKSPVVIGYFLTTCLRRNIPGPSSLLGPQSSMRKGMSSSILSEYWAKHVLMLRKALGKENRRAALRFLDSFFSFMSWGYELLFLRTKKLWQEMNSRYEVSIH